MSKVFLMMVEGYNLLEFNCPDYTWKTVRRCFECITLCRRNINVIIQKCFMPHVGL